MTSYVLGFRFCVEELTGRRKVALIKKTKPAWQAGKLNGIGGKIEQFETLMGAMVREFHEETDVQTGDWRQFGVLEHDGHDIYLFVSHGKEERLKQMTDEAPSWVYLEDVHVMPSMSNLAWMIPLALDKDQVKAMIVDSSAVPE